MGAAAGPPEDDPGSRLDAEHLVRDLAQRWQTEGRDVNQLLDRVSARLAEEAHHELRQILTMVSTQLELADLRAAGDQTTELSDDQVDELMTALQRGATIVATYLDRNEVAKFLLHLDASPTEIGSVMQEQLALQGVHPDEAPTDISIEATSVVADREKIAASLGYLVSRFWRARKPGAKLSVTIEPEGRGLHGFVGLVPPPFDRGDLAGLLEATFDLEEIGIDIPYVRAVFEQHGGSLYVEETGGAVGYGFRLPPEPRRSELP